MVTHGDRRIARLASDAAALALVPLITRLSGFVFVVLVARRYGQHELGVYRFALILVWYFLEFARLGLSPLLLREMAARPPDARSIYQTGLLVRLAATALSWMVLGLTVALLGYDPVTRRMVGLFALALLFMIVVDTNNQAFVAAGRARLNFLTETAGAVSFLALSVLALHLDAGIVGLAAAKLASAVLQALMGWGLLLPYVRPSGLAVHRQELGRLLGEGWPFAMIALTSYLISEADVFLLKQLTSYEIVGLYAAAQTIVSALKAALAALGMAVSPTLAKLFADGNHADVHTFSALGLRMSAWLSLLCIVLLTALGQPLVRGVFGEAFVEVVPALRIVVWVLPFYGLCNIIGYGIIAAGGEKWLLPVNGFVAALNIGLNLWLIPRSPLLGVSSAAVISYAACAALYLRLAARFEVRPAGMARLHVRPLVAALGTYILLSVVLVSTRGMVAALAGQTQWPALVLHGTLLGVSAMLGLLCYLFLLRVLGELDAAAMLPLRGAILVPDRARGVGRDES